MIVRLWWRRRGGADSGGRCARGRDCRLRFRRLVVEPALEDPDCPVEMHARPRNRDDDESRLVQVRTCGTLSYVITVSDEVGVGNAFRGAVTKTDDDPRNTRTGKRTHPNRFFDGPSKRRRNVRTNNERTGLPKTN